VLHIGLMKSGTSFIQRTLMANPDALQGQGVLFPGKRWSEQVRAVRDLLGMRRKGSDPTKTEGAWPRLVEEIDAWPGTAVISMEYLAGARPQGIDRLAGSVDPERLHVVMTVRDLGRTIPAMWQESLQNYRTWTWEEFLDGVRNGDPSVKGPARTFWRQHNARAIAQRWSRVVPPERLTLITLPPPGADPMVLWERFCQVLGVDPGSCEPGPRRNDSLGAASAVLMRELNVALAERGVSPAAYQRVVKQKLAKAELSKRKSTEPAIGFDHTWVNRRADRMIGQLRRMPLTVLGDLEELRPVPVPGVHPSDVTERQELDAAVDGLAAFLARVAKR
jgi:hypothetical protein